MIEPHQQRTNDGSSGAPPDHQQDLARFKEFWGTSMAIEHRTSVMVLLALIVLGGVNAYRGIPRESFPEIEIPMIAVNTSYPGVSPADIESLITRPLEDEISTIADIKEMTSTSVEGYSSVVAEFETTMNLDEALQKIREKVDLAKPEIPAEAEDPLIVEFNFSELPIMQVNLSGEYGLVRLKEIGEELQDRIEQIPSVLRVDLRGGLEREVKVDVHLDKLQYYGLAIEDVIETIWDENVNVPGGSIDVGSLKYLVRVDGEFEDPAIISDLVIATEDGRPIYVRDIADVEFGFAERDTYARLDATPVVTLDVVKRSGRNIIETSESVKDVVRRMRAEFPPTTVVKVTSDESDDIREMVSSLENNIVSGLILIVGILLFFLGTGSAIFVALSIPLSMLLSFVVLQLSGLTLNMVVLFSLILALGMLVDNAIVIVENIYRYMEEGWDRGVAAKKATGEVAGPVIAATLTTLAAFAPLMFWPGQVGEFMKYLPATLIVTLSSSLFVAIIIIPTLCAMFMRLEDEPRPPMTRATRWTGVALAILVLLRFGASNVLAATLLAVTVLGLWALQHFVLGPATHHFMKSWLPVIVGGYERQLRRALDHRGLVIAGSIAVLVLTAMLFVRFNNGVEYFPEGIPPNIILVDIDLPVGSRAEATNKITERMEEEIKHVPGISDAESVVAIVGGSGSGNFREGGPSGPDAARITVSLAEFSDREFDSYEVLSEMQRSVGTRVAGAEIKIDKANDGPVQGLPINIEVIGEDPALLKGLADRVLKVLRNDAVYGKLVGLESDLDEAQSELEVTVDREKAALYGVSTKEVGMAIRGAIQGIEAAKYRTGEDEYDIVVRLGKEYRDELQSLRDLTVMSEGTQIPLLSVATWEVGEGYGSIKRKDQTRMATISADVRAGLNSNAVLGEVKAALADFETTGLPPGYQMRYTGQQQEQGEAQAFLQTAFLVAIMLIGFILVSQFNSVVKPLIILTSVAMSTVGVLLGLMLFQMPFGVIMTGVGIISLAGIVVNNAIVLIDYIDVLRTRDKLDRREALVRGGHVRFRPVVLTAITTALGLVPLAIGLNFDFMGLYTRLDPNPYWGGEQAAWWGPMAVAVIAGILFATFLTLIVVPVMYSLVDDMSDFFKVHYLPAEALAHGGQQGGAEKEMATIPESGSARGAPAPEPVGVRSQTADGPDGPRLKPFTEGGA
ncbi:MAG: efflux RND transporter permease subunit [Gemmatimonadota bacterium]|nr:MAG: efflux RND transporter permease subunit [Gemmatimonadota bacterium]